MYLMKTDIPIMNIIISDFDKQGIQDFEIESQLLFATIDRVCINYLINYPNYFVKQIKQKILKNYE